MCQPSDYKTGHKRNTALKPKTGQTAIVFTMVTVLSLIFYCETHAEFNKTVAWFGKRCYWLEEEDTTRSMAGQS